MKTILYSGYGWADNIGNSFIDFGVDYLLKLSLKNDDMIVNMSNIPNFIKGNYGSRFPFSMFQDPMIKNFDLRTLTKVDYIVLGGSLFTKKWFNYQNTLIKYLINEQVPVIVIGGGGGKSYSQNEQKTISPILSKLNLYALITRDSRTFEFYNKYANYAYDGIDSAFFLNNVFKPVKIDIENLCLSIFDIMDHEPNIKYPKDSHIVKLYHSYVDIRSVFYLRKKFLNFFKLISKKHLISDCPFDYLHLFGNAKYTYTDRVHACVATLIFGGEAMYFDNSDRSYLFERIGIYDQIKSGLTKLDMKMIEDEKSKQLKFLKEIFSES